MVLVELGVSYLRLVPIAMVMLAVWVIQALPGKDLHLVFCDVGQGDGALITMGYFQALIDTGKYGDKILSCLSEHMPFWDRKIEVVFLSHPDNDHVGAFADVKKAYEIGQVIEKAGNGDVVRFGDLYFDILYGGRNGINDCDSDNNCSEMIKVVWKKFSALFTGDAEKKEELAILGRGVIKKTDILKVAHHGSKTSSTLEFLRVVEPKIAIISVGANNRYGHPSRDTLLRLDIVGARILRTDKMGTIDVETDGEKYWVR